MASSTPALPDPAARPAPPAPGQPRQVGPARSPDLWAGLWGLDGTEICTHCGLCLTACPTYRVLDQREMESPRGRVYLVKAAVAGRLEVDPGFAEHIDLCLDCRACETACPSGVPVGRLVELARAAMARRGVGAAARHRAVRWVLRYLLPYPGRLHLAARLVRLAQRAGVFHWLERFRAAGPPGRRAGGNAWPSPLLRPLAALADLAGYLPPLEASSARGTHRRWVRPAPGMTAPGRPSGLPAAGSAPRPTVALFLGCVMDVLFPATHEATARVFLAGGCDVIVPPAQRCCGALHLHQGDRDGARALARTNLAAFSAWPDAPVAVNASGCTTAMLEYPDLLRGDPRWAEAARAFAARVADVATLWDRLGIGAGPTPVPARVGYADPCHLAHGQKVRAEPRRLLAGVRGLELVELPEADSCCGSAGLYNVLHPEVAAAIGRRKAALVPADLDAVVTANPGCVLQLRRALRDAGRDVAVWHLADVLARSWNGAAPAASKRRAEAR